MFLNSYFAGVKMGVLIGKMEQLEKEGYDLKERVAQLPPEQQFTFALLQTKSVERIWRTVSLEDALKLTAGVLDVPEEELWEDLNAAEELARQRLEDMDLL